MQGVRRRLRDMVLTTGGSSWGCQGISKLLQGDCNFRTDLQNGARWCGM